MKIFLKAPNSKKTHLIGFKLTPSLQKIVDEKTRAKSMFLSLSKVLKSKL